MAKSMAMRRILQLEPKNRVQRSVHIEQEFGDIIDDHKLSISDITNVALERFFRDQGYIK